MQFLLKFLSQFECIQHKLDVIQSSDLFSETTFDFRWSDDLCQKGITFEQNSRDESIKTSIVQFEPSSQILISSEKMQFLSPTLDALLQVLCRKMSMSANPMKELLQAAFQRLTTHSRCDFIRFSPQTEYDFYIHLIDSMFLNIHQLCPDLISMIDLHPIDLGTIHQRIVKIPSRDIRNIIANHYSLYLYIANESFQFKHTTYNVNNSH